MAKRLILGIVVSAVVIFLPALGNADILRSPHLWVLFVIGVLASVLQPGYNPITISFRAKDRGTGAQIIWSVYVTQLGAILEAAYLNYPRSVAWDAVAVVALLVAVLGLALRTWAVFTLGDLFTMHLAVQRGHTVVRNGPYSVMRHPSYVGAFFLYVSTVLFLHAWYSAAVAAVILPLAFMGRVHYEEKLLKGEFGKEYETYCQEVNRFIPKLFS